MRKRAGIISTQITGRGEIPVGGETIFGGPMVHWGAKKKILWGPPGV